MKTKLKVISQRLFDVLVILSGFGVFALSLIGCEFLGINGEGEGVISALLGVSGAYWVNQRLSKELKEGEAFVRIDEANRKLIQPPPPPSGGSP